MKNTQLIVCKNIDLSMDGETRTTYEIIAKDTRIDRNVAMLTLTLEELETYVGRLTAFLKQEKEPEGGERCTK